MTAATAAPEKAAISFGNPDDPPQGAINATNPRSSSDPGPQNPAIRDQFPSAFSPPPTDVGGMPLSWASFNNAPRRVQNGGWAREVTQSDFTVADTISGVNMRLGGSNSDGHQCVSFGLYERPCVSSLRPIATSPRASADASPLVLGDQFPGRRISFLPARSRRSRLVGY
jgi:hypothetical protein